MAGRLIAGPRLSIVRRSEDAGRMIYLKRRCWYTAVLIAGARLSSARFVTLPQAEWHPWESAVYRQVYREQVTISADGTLILPAQPGHSLASLLAHGASEALLLAGVGAALRALARLHDHEIALPDGRLRRFSHGDATIANVTYEPASDTAYWFDFETAHAPYRPHTWRCADDLRAALFSAAAWLGPSQSDGLAKLLLEAYPEPRVLAELRSMILQLLNNPDPWHLAQAPLPYEQHLAHANALLRLLP